MFKTPMQNSPRAVKTARVRVPAHMLPGPYSRTSDMRDYVARKSFDFGQWSRRKCKA